MILISGFTENVNVQIFTKNIQKYEIKIQKQANKQKTFLLKLYLAVNQRVNKLYFQSVHC
jgi:hypothetical protein